MTNNQLIIVMPTYNELENLTILIPKIGEVFRKNNIIGSLLIVDDNSPDGTGKHLSKHSSDYANSNFELKLLHRAGKLGLGTAYIEGYNLALKSSPDFILGMDADFSHDPKYINQIYNELQTNDMVIGSRYVDGGGIQN